jgi:hypothetical protein
MKFLLKRKKRRRLLAAGREAGAARSAPDNHGRVATSSAMDYFQL